ncbi:MAG: TonB-dependent receptor, partial [Asticcacaulis sp.]|nr:TonB-dependent receptor [Asticcacaulis sp.]
YGQDLLDGQLNWNSAYSPWHYRSSIAYQTETLALASNDNAGNTLEQGLAYTRALTPAASMDLKALYRRSSLAAESRMAANGDISRNLSTASASEHVLSGQLSWQPNDDVVIRGDIEHALTTNDSGGAYQANAAAAPAAGAGAWVQEARTESELSSAWQLSHAINAEAGVRLEHSSLSLGSDQAEARAHLYPKPRLRLSLSPSPALQLRLRMEREVSQLNFGDAGYYTLPDRTLRAGYPELVPAKTWLCEGAVEYRFLERGSAMLSYTQSRISDVIDRTPIRTANATYDAAGNIGAASADSVSGWLNLPTDSWSLPQGQIKLSTTWKSSAVTDPVTLTQRRLSGEQPLAWRVEFSQDLPRQRTAWGFSLDNGWSNDNWQVAEHDTSSAGGWARAFVNYRPAPNVTLALELNNLAGRAI